MLLLASCEGARTVEAKKAVEAQLTDPASVQYREVKVYPGGAVCGEFNAKNRLGGYAGFEKFAHYRGKLVFNALHRAALCSDYPNKEELLRKVDPQFKTAADVAECKRRVLLDADKSGAVSATASDLKRSELQAQQLTNRAYDECGQPNDYPEAPTR